MARSPKRLEPRTRSARLAWLWLLPLAGALWLVALPTAAHATGQTLCELRPVPGGYDLTLDAPLHFVSESVGLESLEPSAAELRGARARIVRQFEDTIAARTPRGTCALDVGPPALFDGAVERRVAYPIALVCPEGPVELSLRWRMDLAPTSSIVCVLDGSPMVFRAGQTSHALAAPPTLAATHLAFLRDGGRHVFGGLDHVCFLVGLLLPLPWLIRRRWTRAVALVTGFTLGHSVTLLLAGLSVIALPPRLTESLIAVSVAYVGLDNLLHARQRAGPEPPRQRGARWPEATVFGLVHGFGFAAVLGQTPLPERARVTALLSFNLGVELAQLALVLTVLPLLTLLGRRVAYTRWVVVPASALLVLVGALWTLDRTLGLGWFG